MQVFHFGVSTQTQLSLQRLSPYVFIYLDHFSFISEKTTYIVDIWYVIIRTTLPVIQCMKWNFVVSNTRLRKEYFGPVTQGLESKEAKL